MNKIREILSKYQKQYILQGGYVVNVIKELDFDKLEKELEQYCFNKVAEEHNICVDKNLERRAKKIRKLIDEIEERYL